MSVKVNEGLYKCPAKPPQTPLGSEANSQLLYVAAADHANIESTTSSKLLSNHVQDSNHAQEYFLRTLGIIMPIRATFADSFSNNFINLCMGHMQTDILSFFSVPEATLWSGSCNPVLSHNMTRSISNHLVILFVPLAFSVILTNFAVDQTETENLGKSQTATWRMLPRHVAERMLVYMQDGL